MSRSSGWVGPLASIWILLAGAAAVRHMPHSPPATELQTQTGADLPDSVGPWTGKALEVDARAIDILETPDVVLREYQAGAEPAVWLARVSGFGQRAAFHPPELCYVGSDFDVVEREPLAVEVNGNAYRLMRLVIEQNRTRVEAWYWFTAGPRATANYYQQQFWLTLDSLMGRSPAGTLVRLSTLQDDPVASRKRLHRFLESFESILLKRSAS